MISILSPAKSLDYSPTSIKDHTHPPFPEESNYLIERLRKKSVRSLIKLMDISKSLAELNVARYQSFSPSSDFENSKQAILTFKGDVYRGLEAETLTEDDLNYTQNHVRILSGLYGLLRPLDLVQPYRLEMGTKLKLGRKNNLYEFWNSKITHLLNEVLSAGGHKVLVNLASKEYYKAIKPEEVSAKIVHIHFREYRNDKLMFLSYNAKKARGLMVRYIVRNRINSMDEVLNFDTEGYGYDESLSNENELTFTR